MKRLASWIIGGVLITALCVLYVCTHPLVFNESFLQHAHCIPQAGMALRMYANEHHGSFPYHTNGYGDALFLLGPPFYALTGPGYDSTIFETAARTGGDIPESQCGRVYVQGLTESCNPRIALLFDKMATPGGDHCHGLKRLTAPVGREVSFANGSHTFVRNTEWQKFRAEQIDLLVENGFSKAAAQKLYDEVRR